MRNTVRIAAMSVLLATAPAIGAGKPAKEHVKAAATAMDTALTPALIAFRTELGEALGGHSDLVIRLDKLGDFTLSAPTRAKIRAILGNTMPSGIERRPNDNGGVDYRWTVKPGSYVAPDGDVLRWSELTVSESVDKNLDNFSHTLRWNRLKLQGKSVNVTIGGMRADARQQRAVPGSALGPGTSDGAAASILIDDGSGPGTALRLDELTYKISRTARGRLADLVLESGTRRISTMGTQLDDFRFRFRLLGTDAALAGKLLATKQYSDTSASLEQLIEAPLPFLRGFAQLASESGSALEIDELGIAFQGKRMALTGHLSLVPGVEEDFATMAGLGKRIDAKLIATVPTALIVDVARIMAREQMRAEPRAAVPDAAVNETAEGIRDMAIGKIIGGGLGRLENDVLIIPIEAHDGVITLNGKKFELPTQPDVEPAARTKAKAKAKK